MQTAKQRRRSNRLISTIDIVAFSSVLLVLLYLLIAPYVGLRGIPSPDVEMVKVNHPTEMPDAYRDDAIIITIKKDGRVYWGNEMIASSDLPIKLKDRIDHTRPQVIYFKIDARTAYCRVRDVLQAVPMSGLDKVALLVEERKY